MPESSFTFHQLLREGAAQNDGVRVLSLVGRPVHPTIHRGMFWHRKIEQQSTELTVWQVSIINLRVIKQVWVGMMFVGAILRWRSQTSNARQRILIVDAAYVSALPWVLMALVGSKVTKLGIFADIYSYMGRVADARGIATASRSAIRWVALQAYSQFDGFILLTKQMGAVVNLRNKPSMIMEGLIDAKLSTDDGDHPIKADHPTILYAGALRREYGLDDLLAGFTALTRPDVRLVIYGAGPFSVEILAAARVDARIEFGGRIPVSQVMHEQRKAWILVNTRRADDEFTKYSFPSKLLSYMSSGTAVLTTMLPGMPKEYEDQVVIVKGVGAHGVTTALNDLLTLPRRDLEARGKRAQEFVMTTKNNVFQTRRVLDFGLGIG
jgi:glycosyltransferase involved in cell wall biosynthesis